VTKVVIVGDYPEIEKAYKSAEVDVEVQARKTPVTSPAAKKGGEEQGRRWER